MDKTVLVDKFINDGRILIGALEKENFVIDTAMWFYSEETDEWKLVIATPLVDEIGPRETYRRIQAILEELPSLSITLTDITALRPSNSMIKALKSNIGHSREISLKGTVFDGILINNAYIYCVA
ncbi:MAG TPA: hypothetical protein VLB04_07830 [Methanotrichaceae archaeon]|nr:hypothetical protein [Methanotrichaceae archaeon]